MRVKIYSDISIRAPIHPSICPSTPSSSYKPWTLLLALDFQRYSKQSPSLLGLMF